MSDTTYSVSVRNLCEFAAKVGDLDLRFTPSPSAQQGREGHQLVASRRPPEHEAEVSLTGMYNPASSQVADAALRVSGRADGFDAARNVLEEVKTFRGSVAAIAPNHNALHWAQLKVYGWLMCQNRLLPHITLRLVYFDVVDHTEHPVTENWSGADLRVFFEALCQRFLAWATAELAHRRSRDAALQALGFPQLPFRPGQRDMAAGVYRACVQSRPLLVQAPTGIGKTMGCVFPALRAMPERGIDKLFFLTAKTPGRQVALEALHRVRATLDTGVLRIVELVAKEKSCEYPDKACHGQSCPLAQGFYDRLPGARWAAAQRGWLDQQHLRAVSLAHRVCPYYVGHEMVRWADVVVGDYNYYFDRSAMLHTLTTTHSWRVSVLVDEAHNLYSRACSMYSAELTHGESAAMRPELPAPLRGSVDEMLNQWQLLLMAARRAVPSPPWKLLDGVPEDWLRSVQRFNSAAGEYLNLHPAEPHGAWLAFYFKTVAFATLAEAFGDHSLCEWTMTPDASTATGRESQRDLLADSLDGAGQAGGLALRNIVPEPFIRARIHTADSLVLFSATLNPADYYMHLLGLPETTQSMDVPSPFDPLQLAVVIQPISTRRDDRLASLDALVDAVASQYAAQPGNYLAFFSSFDYLELALARLRQRHPGLLAWAQQRQMSEPDRQTFLAQFDAAGQGIGFAVLGGVFGEGVDLPGKRLIGACIATLGLPQFDAVNEAICQRMQARFGRGYDYTYLYPGMQKVVQAAGRVIRSQHDTGTVLLLDDRYLQQRYRARLPHWWNIAIA